MFSSKSKDIFVNAPYIGPAALHSIILPLFSIRVKYAAFSGGDLSKNTGKAD